MPPTRLHRFAPSLLCWSRGPHSEPSFLSSRGNVTASKLVSSGKPGEGFESERKSRKSLGGGRK